MITYRVLVERENNVSGNRRHGTIYPGFSRIKPPAHLSSGENIVSEQLLKITIEDGKFKQASKSIGYTGQHTDLYIDFDDTKNRPTNETGKSEIVLKNACYIYGTIYRRNKYGSTDCAFRLDCETMSIQRPIKKGDTVRWYTFKPTQNID